MQTSAADGGERGTGADGGERTGSNAMGLLPSAGLVQMSGSNVWDWFNPLAHAYALRGAAGQEAGANDGTVNTVVERDTGAKAVGVPDAAIARGAAYRQQRDALEVRT